MAQLIKITQILSPKEIMSLTTEQRTLLKDVNRSGVIRIINVNHIERLKINTAWYKKTEGDSGSVIYLKRFVDKTPIGPLGVMEREFRTILEEIYVKESVEVIFKRANA